MVATGAACGSSQPGSTAPSASCARERAALDRIGPVETLGDASRALRRSIAGERRLLAGFRHDDPLAPRILQAIAAGKRSLVSIERSDPQKTMSPIRTGAPDARRAVETLREILRVFCGRR